eukprot:NODE_572_length_5896_cov_0.685872.p1 type:complete len:418 gc:universal NODE_572_length_5896_cov_0.685872:1300-47(-)
MNKNILRNLKFSIYHHRNNFYTDTNYKFKDLRIAYESWGKIANPTILLFTGLSASMHACSNNNLKDGLGGNREIGWWEKFIGPDRPLDTNKFHIVCANYIGGCFGSTGPMSFKDNGERYKLDFPVVTIFDQARAQYQLLQYLGVENQIHAVVGSSKGGMASLAFAALYPEVSSVISISSCSATHPYAIGLRSAQRQILISDKKWNNGNYYDSEFPKDGMKLARMLATISYRSGPEWEQRYARKRQLESIGANPTLHKPEFLIETYLDYQGEKYSEGYDPNSLLYLSKSMDLFDISSIYHPNEYIRERLVRPDPSVPPLQEFCPSYLERRDDTFIYGETDHIVQSLKFVNQPILIMGVKTDILFPIEQQRELADKLKKSGNNHVTFYEIDSIYGHDTFLLDLTSMGAAIKGFLETRVD